jgi:hypothetical protein
VIERIHPVAMLTGIIAIQNIVKYPFTRRMNTGSPWTLDQRLLITVNVVWGRSRAATGPAAESVQRAWAGSTAAHPLAVEPPRASLMSGYRFGVERLDRAVDRFVESDGLAAPLACLGHARDDRSRIGHCSPSSQLICACHSASVKHSTRSVPSLTVERTITPSPGFSG